MSQYQDKDIKEITRLLEKTPDEEDLFAPIKTFRRRMIIRYLSHCPPDAAVDLRDITTSISALENGLPVNEVSNSEYTRTYTGISQRDTKKLSMMGILNTQRKNTVTRGEKFEFYASILDDLDESLS